MREQDWSKEPLISSAPRLFNIEVPSALSREGLIEIERGYQSLSFTSLEHRSLKAICGMLSSSELKQLVDEEKITFAMIRPHTSMNKLGYEELEAEEAIVQDISEHFDIVFKISFCFNPMVIEDFYGGSPREKQLSMEPVQEGTMFENRWQEFVELMTSGPSTILLLYSEDGGVIQKFRNKIGSFRIDPGTLREKWAVDMHNNLFHGSDSTAAVMREIGVIENHLEQLIDITDKLRLD